MKIAKKHKENMLFLLFFKNRKDDYLAVTFTSSIFRFVDDLEIRIDTDQQLIHLRSASRVGRSDGGVNRKRLERLKMAFQLKTN